MWFKKRKKKVNRKKKKIKKKKFKLTPYKLKKISFFLAIVGIFLIFAISIFIKPKSIDGCDLENIKDGKYVEISGTITDEIDLAENFMLFKLENNTCEIDIICSCVRTLQDQKVIVQGKVQTYKDKKQILADKIQDG